MKNRIFVIMVIAAMLLSAFGIDSALAGAYDTEFTTSITYMNIGTATTTTLKLYFYADENDTIPTTYDLNPAPVNAAGSISIGNIGDIAAGFQGSAYLESDQMMQVTLVQVPQSSTTVVNRGMSNGFITGGPTALIPTVLRNKNDTHSVFSVQNADSVANNVTFDFNPIPGQGNEYTFTVAIQPGAAYYVDAGLTPELGDSFNGSAVITATQLDNVTAGKIVASSMEYYITGVGVYAFEGFASGADVMYMPSAMCNYSSTLQTSYYAIQSTETTTDIRVTFTATDGEVDVWTYADLTAGSKVSISGCNGGMTAGKLGSAVIEGLDGQIAAIGKVNDINTTGFRTAFNGVAAGSLEFALPYVRWATTDNYTATMGHWRTFIGIQNVGADTAIGDVILVKYWDYLGNLACTDTLDEADELAAFGGFLPSGAKVNTNPTKCDDVTLTEFGEFWSTTLNRYVYGGAVTVEGPAGSLLTAVARTQRIYPVYPQVVGEDANSQPIR